MSSTGSRYIFRFDEDEDLRTIRQRYRIVEDREVLSFLSNHPGAIKTLVHARPIIEKFFGGESPVELQVIEDPDAEEISYLAATIRTKLRVPESLERLKEFDRSWWNNRSTNEHADLIITIGHV